MSEGLEALTKLVRVVMSYRPPATNATKAARPTARVDKSKSGKGR